MCGFSFYSITCHLLSFSLSFILPLDADHLFIFYFFYLSYSSFMEFVSFKLSLLLLSFSIAFFCRLLLSCSLYFLISSYIFFCLCLQSSSYICIKNMFIVRGMSPSTKRSMTLAWQTQLTHQGHDFTWIKYGLDSTFDFDNFNDFH